ncbi:glycoside hydrolase family 74 protein [Gelatoporia subvermispora B]|uniref:Glycoside hydrolase family 74 protein n=1 Tax=Ceriporiopsis subvermispora (strain B) TaxID=914234 RepID=M2RTN7_CERS8|nr:glycoside hydrolase family 74 protein [Gelatoporia subvermispora B]
MYWRPFSAVLALASTSCLVSAASQSYSWKNVKIGGGGGFVPNIVFNPSEQGLVYARTDIGGAYIMNADESWTPLLDFADNDHWNYWGTDALATDPVDTNRLYLATGMYTNSWDPNDGQILISTNKGQNFTVSPLPFKVGGNMPGRGVGERLVVDPNSNNILFFGARSGNGLWKSTDFAQTWSKVETFTATGNYVPDPTDTTGYNSDPIGLAWVTFDPTSGESGSPTPRIFVGVVSNGTQENIFVSEDAGSTWNAVAGQNNTYLPHKGVLSAAEHTLYISYSNGAGPYDGTLGAVMKYNITTGEWTDITPVSGSDLYFGFGGLTLDPQRPGTIMVAALNSWWPNGQIFRTTDGGQTWTGIWEWVDYPEINYYYTYDDTSAPWLGANATTTALTTQVGWMMEGLSIDPFDSNHWLYGTGETIYGGHDLLKWDLGDSRNVTIESLADGVEEESVESLISPPTGPSLISAVGDDGGFVHYDLDTPPANMFQNPTWSTTVDLDYAGNDPTNIVRIGNGDSSSGKQVALSTDSGNTWSQDYGAADNVSGGKVALSANGDTVLWATSGNGVQVSQYTNSFSAVSSLPASTTAIASDKRNDSIFYAASGSSFYVSTDGGTTFSVSGSLGESTSPVKIVVHPNITGDVWVSTDQGLFHSTDTGSTFTTVPGVTEAWAIALGAPATTGGYPALFAAANIGGVGYFRSDDAGTNWAQINDASHGFGSVSSNVIAGDPRVYGRVYIGTNGRGIFYGDIAGAAPPPSSTAPISSSTSKPVSSSTSSVPVSSSAPISSHSSSAPSSAPSSTPTSVASQWGQCGGTGWAGPTACASGSTCTVQNPYYSQCLPQ